MLSLASPKTEDDLSICQANRFNLLKKTWDYFPPMFDAISATRRLYSWFLSDPPHQMGAAIIWGQYGAVGSNIGGLTNSATKRLACAHIYVGIFSAGIYGYISVQVMKLPQNRSSYFVRGPISFMQNFNQHKWGYKGYITPRRK